MHANRQSGAVRARMSRFMKMNSPTAETVAGLEIVLRHLLVAGLDDLIAAAATKIIGRLDTRLRDTIARSTAPELGGSCGQVSIRSSGVTAPFGSFANTP